MSQDGGQTISMYENNKSISRGISSPWGTISSNAEKDTHIKGRLLD